MREVGTLAGVSGKTVSRVINGDRYVSAEVRSRVQQAITELAYVPNMLSQTFRTGRDSAIGVAVPDIADAFFGAVIQSVERYARDRRAAVIVSSLGDDPSAEPATVTGLLRRQVAGLIIAPISTDQAYLLPWQPRTAMVFVDRPGNGITADSVIEDDFGGAAAAVGHLIERGHRRIAFVGNAAAVVTTGRRLAGYRAALTAAGITPDPLLHILYQADPGQAVPTLHNALADPDPITAVFSSNSHSSIALVPELHTSGHADLAFVSFGDFPMASALRPAVTVLDQNPGRVGSAAAERLFSRIDQVDRKDPAANGPPRARKRHLVLSVPLVVRESTPVIPTPYISSPKNEKRKP